MSVSIGFIIFLMILFAGYTAYRLFYSRKLLIFTLCCLQLFMLTLAIIGFAINVQTNQLVELSYIVFGIFVPALLPAYDAGILSKIQNKLMKYKIVRLVVDALKPFFIALGKLKKYIPSRMDKGEGLYKKALEHHKNGNLMEAVSYYTKAAKKNKLDYKGYYNMGIALDEAGKNTDAELALKKTIELKPDFIDAYNNLGITYSSAGKFNSALEIYQKAILRNPRDYRVYYNMGITLSEMGKYQEAVKVYKKARELNTDEPEINLHMAASLIELRKYDEAAEAYKNALKIKPSDSDLFFNLSMVYSLLRKHDIAMDNLRKAIELNHQLKHEARSNAAFDSIRKHKDFEDLVS